MKFRAWKIRQDSYQQAIGADPGGTHGAGSKHRRQDSYQQAVRTSSEFGKLFFNNFVSDEFYECVPSNDVP